MSGEVKRERIEIPVVCDRSALTAEQRERHQGLDRRLRADVREVVELEDGYAFRHSPDGAVLLAVAEFVALERLCCPFLEFKITVGRDGGAVWLRMRGAGQAKGVLEAEMGA